MVSLDQTSLTVSNYFFAHILDLPKFQKTINTLDLSKHLINYLHLSQSVSNCNALDNNINYILSTHWTIIMPKTISSYLRHSNFFMDNILHHTHLLIVENKSGLPLVYLPKYVLAKNGYTCEMNNITSLSAFINYIGTYFVMFYANNKWMFFCYDFDGISEFNRQNNTILFEHLNNHIDKLDKTKCHHLLLVDNRIKSVIVYPFNAFVVYIKSSDVATLTENTSNPYDFFVTNEPIDLQCHTNIIKFIKTLDDDNNKTGKLHKKGIICCVKFNDRENLYVEYTTEMYDYVQSLLPHKLGVNSSYLYLYQNNHLATVLNLTNMNASDIIKRINTSILTMERELLDIYHATRNQNNAELYNILPSSYKKILYAIHNQYIKHKNTLSDELFDSVSIDIVHEIFKKINFNILLSIFADRIVLCNKLRTLSNINISLKKCIYLTVQSHLINNELPISCI